jgi:hypothetical protein
MQACHDEFLHPYDAAVTKFLIHVEVFWFVITCGRVPTFQRSMPHPEDGGSMLITWPFC